MRPVAPPYETYAVKGFHGELASAFRPRDLSQAVQRLVDPASAHETLHWGRNYLYSVVLETAAGTTEVVVKQFRNQGMLSRIRRRLFGSKALKSWRGAQALVRAEVPTPEPVMLVESNDPGGASFFVSRRLKEFFEARHFFRALNADREREEFPGVDPQEVLEEMAWTLRRLHERGVWHRDVSVGNLLVRRRTRDESGYDIFFVDLNRAHTGRRLTVGRRTRDLCRLRIFKREHREAFLRAYWEERMRAYWLKRLLFLVFQHGFLLKVRVKEVVRYPFSVLAGALGPKHGHVHIPPPPKEASPRDSTVWDRLSDQPHQHAGRLQRVSFRWSHARAHLTLMSILLANLPQLRRRYRALHRNLYREPRPWDGIGIAVRPWKENPEALLRALEELGVRLVLLRLHPWQEDHSAEEALARELHRRGWDITYALPQNRELVRDLARWRAAVSEIAERFGPYGRRFQVGQAINRSKWGLWNHHEYMDLASAAGEILRDGPEVELLGPAVIDYEFHVTAAVLNLPWEDFRFDIVSSLLYVDRRGAPENRQYGFDTVDKVVQLKAIAETARHSSGRSWITEVNWPLWEGPHSPAGRDVSVNEELQADYLVRYYLLALGSGMVERVYWWQLMARGYGLCHPTGEGELRCRPSFFALRTLSRQLEGSTFLHPLETAETARLYLFRAAQGRDVIVGWSAGGPTSVRLPRPAAKLIGRDGETLPPPPTPEVQLNSSPRYFWLVPE